VKEPNEIIHDLKRFENIFVPGSDLSELVEYIRAERAAVKQEEIDIMRRGMEILKGLEMSIKWEIAPSIMDLIKKTVQEYEALERVKE